MARDQSSDRLDWSSVPPAFVKCISLFVNWLWLHAGEASPSFNFPANIEVNRAPGHNSSTMAPAMMAPAMMAPAMMAPAMMAPVYQVDNQSAQQCSIWLRKERLRIANACQVCRSKKVKCDGGRPGIYHAPLPV